LGIAWEKFTAGCRPLISPPGWFDFSPCELDGAAEAEEATLHPNDSDPPQSFLPAGLSLHPQGDELDPACCLNGGSWITLTNATLTTSP
jgi:hypothetical protein